jgi:hypothetical protein
MPRPMFTPTADQRALVKSMAGLGTPHEDIARKIGIRSPKTLRKHFRDELDLGSTDADYNVRRTLYQMATSGKDTAATIFWMKVRAGWRERPVFEPAAVPPPPFIVARAPEGGQS